MQLKQHTKGFTLIEILIALLILSIGLLGMAGIQLQGLRGTTSSTVRSDATILANDIAERTRANPAAIDLGGAQNTQYSTVDTRAIICGTRPTMCSSVSTTGENVAIAQCSSAQMAVSDIYEFACGLGDTAGVNNLIPPEVGQPLRSFATITCRLDGNGNCPAGSELTVNVNWTDLDPDTGNNILKTISMVFIP